MRKAIFNIEIKRKIDIYCPIQYRPLWAESSRNFLKETLSVASKAAHLLKEGSHSSWAQALGLISIERQSIVSQFTGFEVRSGREVREYLELAMLVTHWIIIAQKKS